jgi:hypothetical protein
VSGAFREHHCGCEQWWTFRSPKYPRACGPDSRVSEQTGFDLPELDSVSSDFDLVVNAP